MKKLRQIVRKTFAPGRDVRLKTSILLPDGNQIAVNLNVSERLRALIAAQTRAIEAAQDWTRDETDDEKKKIFYARFADFLTVILGKRNYDDALKAYDFDNVELCRRLDRWAADEVVPRVREASDLEVARRKALFLRAK